MPRNGSSRPENRTALGKIAADLIVGGNPRTTLAGAIPAILAILYEMQRPGPSTISPIELGIVVSIVLIARAMGDPPRRFPNEPGMNAADMPTVDEVRSVYRDLLQAREAVLGHRLVDSLRSSKPPTIQGVGETPQTPTDQG